MKTLMKKLINALVVVTSVALASVANAGMITALEGSDFESRVSGGQVVTQVIDSENYIDYTFKDNFV